MIAYAGFDRSDPLTMAHSNAKWVRDSLTAITALATLCLSHHADAGGGNHVGRYGDDANTPYQESDLVTEAARYIGSGKFTRLPGAWCSDAVSFWLRAIGKPPLANRMAAAALSYGPRVSNPSPGNLVVVRTRRGYAGHVGVVEGVNADGSVRIISGNWGRRVARGTIPRWQVTAFIGT